MLLQESPVADAGAASGARTRFSIMRLPDGRFAFYDPLRPFAGPLSLSDRDGTRHTLLPHLPTAVASSQTVADSKVLSNSQVILTPDNQIVSAFVKGEPLDKETAARVGLPRYLDVWVHRVGLAAGTEPTRVWRGYNGSQMEYQQLSGGRILIPFGSFQPHAKAVPPTGRHKTIVQFSDDGGVSWTESESKLVAPCYAGFNGSNEGACEPAIEQLRDGRLWMLMRTQAGFLYESFSSDQGTTWDSAIPSRFHTSTGPPNILRHKNGWLAVSWNNCEMPPRNEGQGVYGGRDALHIAVSDDDGKTWRGFREIYLDHRRNDNPASSGDRGTAYPLGAYTDDGKIVVLAGQGEGGRNPILIDPDWIVETTAETDFSDGLRQWSVYKQCGPAKNWWRARAVGCELIPHQTRPTAKVLHLRKIDEYPADGAVWNFPNGWQGELTTRVMIRDGYHGASLSLNDRFFDPTDDAGQEFAVFRIDLGADGRVGSVTLDPEKWHALTLRWNLATSECRLLVDGSDAGFIELRNRTLNGVSYVRFRSAATTLDGAGFLVESVKVAIQNPYAPPCKPQDQLQQEQDYVKKMVPRWSL